MPPVLIGVPLATAGVCPLAGQTPEDPAAIVHAALRAVEADSAPTVRARWSARLHADSADRTAVFGLATLDRLTCDYDAAERRYACCTGTRRLPAAWAHRRRRRRRAMEAPRS